MTNGSLRYWSQYAMTVRQEHLTFSRILSHFLPALCNAKMETMQTAVAVKKVWLLCGNSWVQLRVKRRHSQSCSWPTQPSSVLTPKLWEWPSAVLLVLLIGVSTEHSNPPPATLHWRRDWGRRRERDRRGLCFLHGGKQKTKVEHGLKNGTLKYRIKLD